MKAIFATFPAALDFPDCDARDDQMWNVDYVNVLFQVQD